jgi:hypothetical protein
MFFILDLTEGSGVDILITIMRFPVGVAVIPLVAAAWLLVWPVEVVAGAISLPLAAIFMRRSEIKSSWLGQWPYNSLRRIPQDSGKIWGWIFSD